MRLNAPFGRGSRCLLLSLLILAGNASLSSAETADPDADGHWAFRRLARPELPPVEAPSPVGDRDVLSIRDRRLLLLGTIATHGQADTFVIQARAALKRGELSVDELRECLIMLAPYAGYPNVAALISPVEGVIGEMTDGAEDDAAPVLTTDRLRETCESYVSLVGDDDVDALVALFADDCSVEDPVGSDRHVGRDAIRGFFSTLPPMGVSAELSGPVHAVPDARTAAFPFVVRTAEMEMNVIDVMTFDPDGLITSMTAYWQM